MAALGESGREGTKGLQPGLCPTMLKRQHSSLLREDAPLSHHGTALRQTLSRSPAAQWCWFFLDDASSGSQDSHTLQARSVLWCSYSQAAWGWWLANNPLDCMLYLPLLLKVNLSISIASKSPHFSPIMNFLQWTKYLEETRTWNLPPSHTFNRICFKTLYCYR
jgi:hypothetical protein